MKIKVLTSGSKANSSLIISENAKILIDVGATYQYIEQSLLESKIPPSEIDAILITHTHSDHIKGIASFVKRNKTKVYATIAMFEELTKIIPSDFIVEIEKDFSIGNMKVEIIKTSHDSPGSVGYIIREKEISLLYITDTGYLNRKYFPMMKNHDIYYMESNHDEEMLMNGPYPYYLKQRIISDEGHLSNATAATYLAKSIGDRTKYIILAHLSEKNNTEMLARQATEEQLKNCEFSPKIVIAKPLESIEMVEVSWLEL